MRLKKWQRNLQFGLLTLTLLACDPRARYDKYILNNTPYPMLLIIGETQPTIGTSFNDSLLVEPYTKAHILGFSDLGSTVSGYANCPFFPELEDTLFAQVRAPDDRIYELHLTENNDWVHYIISQDKKGENGSCECILNIREEDLPF